MISDFGIKKRLSKNSQLRQRAFFVDRYQAARTRDIRRQNSRQSPLSVLAAQEAPPGSEKARSRCCFGATHLVGELPRSNGQTTAWPSRA